MVCPPVRSKIHSLKLVDYLPPQEDKPGFIPHLVYDITIVFLIYRCETQYDSRNVIFAILFELFRQLDELVELFG